METVNGATVILPAPGGAAAEAARGVVEFGPAQTAGAHLAWLGAMEASDPGPPLHAHSHTDEAFNLAEGEATFRLGDREVVAGAGSFVFVPRGVLHTARNSGPGPVRGIIVLSPGGAEHVTQPVEGP